MDTFEQKYIDKLSLDIKQKLENNSLKWSYIVPKELQIDKVLRFIDDYLSLTLRSKSFTTKLLGYRVILVDFTNFQKDVDAFVEHFFVDIMEILSQNTTCGTFEDHQFCFIVQDHLERDKCCIELDKKLDECGLDASVMGKKEMILVSVKASNRKLEILEEGEENERNDQEKFETDQTEIQDLYREDLESLDNKYVKLCEDITQFGWIK